jgi:hypothetical protein
MATALAAAASSARRRPTSAPRPLLSSPRSNPTGQLAAAATDAASTARVLPDWRSMRAVASFAHPALITHWSPVQQWLAASTATGSMLWLRSQLSRQSRLWKRTDCNREYLYREVSFAAAQELVRAYADELEPIEQEFLDASAANLNFVRRRNRMVRMTAWCWWRCCSAPCSPPDSPGRPPATRGST